MAISKDIQVLRELAKKVKFISLTDIQNERRELWSDFNSLLTDKNPIYVLDPYVISREVFEDDLLKCEEPLLREYEYWLNIELYHASFGDDHITEPWISVKPLYEDSDGTRKRRLWGIGNNDERYADTLALRYEPPFIKTLDDINKIITPSIIINEEKTSEVYDKINDAIGDIIDVVLDKAPDWSYGLSSMYGRLFNPEQMHYQFYDQPELVHSVGKLLSSEMMRLYEEYEKRGYLTNNDNTFMRWPPLQAPHYSRELPSPGERRVLKMTQLWFRESAQEFEGVSPSMFDEFILTYTKPLMEKFGLVGYGCCENLTDRIPYLKKVKNMRRFAMTPWANDEECAKQIEDKYVVSWRPNPSEMVMDYDPDRIKRIVRRAKKIFYEYGCHWEINLKDFITVEYDKERVKNWVQLVRNILEE